MGFFARLRWKLGLVTERERRAEYELMLRRVDEYLAKVEDRRSDDTPPERPRAR